MRAEHTEAFLLSRVRHISWLCCVSGARHTHGSAAQVLWALERTWDYRTWFSLLNELECYFKVQIGFYFLAL